MSARGVNQADRRIGMILQGSQAHGLISSDGGLEATCWCEHRIVIVAPREVLLGRTRSCGALDCVEPVRAS